MLKDVDAYSSIPKALFQSQSLFGDAAAAPDEISTQALSQAASVSAEGDLGYSIAQSASSLRALGLRLPGNAGDSEALILLIDLVSSRLSNENEAQKSISENAARRNTLNEMQQNYKDLVTIRSAIASLTVQRSELIAEKASLQAGLAVQQGRDHDLRNLIAALSVDPDANAEQLANAQLLLESVVAAVGSLESEISSVNGQIGRIEGDIAQNQELEASALQSIATMFKFVIALDGPHANKDQGNSYSKAKREDHQSELFDAINRIYEFDSQDHFIEDALAEDDTDSRNNKLAELSAGLSSIIYTAMDVIAQEKSANQLDLYALAQAKNGGRFRLSL